MFIADDLAGWLVGLFADAGRRRLTSWAAGSDQERALRRAAAAAVEITVQELRPEGGERADELAMVIGQVFTVPVPEALLANCATMLEALHAGISRQLAPLEDAGLTGIQESSAALLGLPTEVLAEKLTTHLVREIVIRGARGGPLEPLAAQFNHDASHLQGRRIEDLLGELARDVSDALARLETANTAAASSLEPRHRRDPRRCSAPPVPASHIPRPDIFGSATSALLNPAGEEPPVVGLVGIAGAGKSRMAREIASNAEILRRFPDGAVWVNVGQNADIRSRQAEVAEAYGGFLPFADALTGMNGLRRLLVEARCLLVLDDVWTLADLKAFDALPGGSAILVTTRHRDALFVTSTAIPVGPFKRSTSLQLIGSLTGATVHKLPGQAAEIARLCGDLPLAVAIASGLVVSGSRWEAVVERLRRGSLLTADSALRDYPFPSLWAAIEASVSSLPLETADVYHALLAFQGRGPAPSDVVRALWAQTSGGRFAGTSIGTDDALADLERRSLLQRDGDGAVTLHDLLFEYLRAQTTADSLTALHSAAADCLAAQWGGLRRNIPALDIADLTGTVAQYALRNTCSHLAAAGRLDELHALLRAESTYSDGRVSNRWYEAHERSGGRITSYLADLRLAWNHAESATDCAVAGGLPVTTLGLEFRYSLMVSSLTALGRQVPMPLLRALVDRGVWTPERALGFAHALVDPDARNAAFIVLARYMAEPERRTVFGHALRGHPDRFALLAQVAGELPGDLIEEALLVIGEYPSFRRSDAIATLADVLPADSLGMLARTIYEHPGSEDNSALLDLTRLAPRLGEPELAAVIRRTRETLPPDQAAALRVRLTPHLSPDVRAAVIREVTEDMTCLLSGPGAKTVAPYLTPGQLAQILDWSASLPAGNAAELLPTLLPYVPDAAVEEARRRALEAARAVTSDYYRARALGLISLTMADPDRSQVVAEARRAAEQSAHYDWGSTPVSVLLDQANALPEALRQPPIDEAWEELKNSMDDVSMAVSEFRLLRPYLDPARAAAGAGAVIALAEDHPILLVPLAADLSEDMLERVLGKVGEIGDRQEQAKAVAALAPYLPGRLLPEALAVRQTIGDESARRGALVGMLPHLSSSRHADALAWVRREARTFTRARLLADVASAAADPQRHDLQREALGTYLDALASGQLVDLLHRLACALTPEGVALAISSLSAVDQLYPAAKPLAVLAQHLPPDRLPELLDGIGSLTGFEPEYALIEVADYLPPQRLLDALEIAKQLAANRAFARLFSRLPPTLGRPMLDEALRRARGIGSVSVRATALAALVGWVPEPERRALFDEAIAASLTLVAFDNEEPDETLVSLSTVLPADLGLEVLAICVRRSAGYFSIRFLADLLNRLPDAQVHDALVLCLNNRMTTFIGFSEDLEPLRLTLARKLPPEVVLAALNDPQSARIRSWCDPLMAHTYVRLAAADRRRWLGRAKSAISALRKPAAICLLAENLPPDLLRDAVDAARSTTSPEALAYLSALVAPPAGSMLRREALEIARTIDDPKKSLSGHLAILAKCAGGERLEALRLAARAAAAAGRPEALAACAQMTEAACLLQAAAAAEIDAAIDDVCRWWP